MITSRTCSALIFVVLFLFHLRSAHLAYKYFNGKRSTRAAAKNGANNAFTEDYATAKRKTRDTRPIFFLHVGPPKTGTTTIQDSFDRNPDALLSDNYVYLGMRNPPQTRDIFGVRRGLSNFRNKKNSTEFLEKLGRELQRPLDFIVSAEDFTIMHNLTDDQGVHFFSLLKSQLKGRQVHVAVGYRRYYELILSSYNQLYKVRQTREPFANWYRKNKSEKQFLQSDCLHAYSAIEEWFTSVSVINMHSPGDLMMKVYCNILPNSTNSCELKKKKLANPARAALSNPSVPLWPRAIATEAGALGLVNFTGKERGLLNNIVKFSKAINYTLPHICLSPSEQQEVLEITMDYEKKIVPDFFASPLGEQELRNGFERALEEQKLCSVNATLILQDGRWLNFFNNFSGSQ